ncbi:MAG TPA: alpha/beta hydrolase [Kofleriaceae bacterium]|nr:alpha/beta hydrolase [Kofleriaceae bacterium]
MSTAVAVAHMTTSRAKVNTYTARDGSTRDVELAYDIFGDRGRPLLLHMGIGAQRIFWDDELCEQLVAAGFRVIRFDARDVGQSTHLDAHVPPPTPTLLKGLAYLDVHAPYDLSDMARDVAGLIDALDLDRPHLVGASLGGMVTQHVGIEFGDRVASLTAIMTSPGGRRFMPKPHALGALFAPAPKSPEQAGLHAEKLFTTIGSKAWSVDGERLRVLGAEAFSRGANPRGFLRQFAAVMASGSRRGRLPTVRVPTLVIHGSQDPMFPLSAGRTLANLVQDGTWLPIAGMGHDLPSPLWPTLVAAIKRHAERADARARV